MYDFMPYLTNDGSIGLYNTDFDDIYHSATGALTEAYEKFILPIDFNLLLKKEKINVLDICYGIGYNSKSFINFLFEKILKEKKYHAEHYISSVYTNNISGNKEKIYNDEIHTNKLSITKNKLKQNTNIDTIYDDNIFDRISVTAIDNDKILAFLSPFIKTDINKFSNKNLNFNYKNINKFLNNKIRNSNIKINKIINFLIFDKIAQDYSEFFNESTISKILNNKDYSGIFEPDLKELYEYKKYSGNISIQFSNLFAFLHNIYYKHISNKYKKSLKTYRLQDINFKLKIDDARNIVKNDTGIYNIIFLDAFTPSKCPCLWTLEFFQLLYEHLEQDGIILTYSTSAAVRNAMINANLHIGYIYNKNYDAILGTIAAKNVELIKHPLSEYDLGLLKTKAGIFYRDKNLTSLNEAIIELRNSEVNDSNLISSSQYNKMRRV